MALLVLGLLHSHPHLGSTDTSISSFKGIREAPNDKLLPCLACACHKKSLVAFSVLTLLFEPLKLNDNVPEYQEVFVSQLVLSLVLSRAPPFLS